MDHRIEVPEHDDAASVDRMQLRAWLQTYPNEVAGIDGAWIREHRGVAVTTEGIAQWRRFIEEAVRQPELLIGGRLMDEFLPWVNGASTHLWVTDYNARAIRFCERYGFRTTGERELWRDRLPNVRMVRESLMSDGVVRDTERIGPVQLR
ncbi:hypothetical protein R1T08_03405 [Streptomyces sp. SBC-4]|nr:hypothetical protein [Streptomyces sp. SBC-4]MDV5143369.1 hypothetical protein [Streptomyces sp. SBC-4]